MHNAGLCWFPSLGFSGAPSQRAVRVQGIASVHGYQQLERSDAMWKAVKYSTSYLPCISRIE